MGRVGSGVSVSAEFYYYLCGLVPVFKKKFSASWVDYGQEYGLMWVFKKIPRLKFPL